VRRAQAHRWKGSRAGKVVHPEEVERRLGLAEFRAEKEMSESKQNDTKTVKVLSRAQLKQDRAVNMGFKFYRRLAGSQENIADLLAMPGGADVDFEIPLLSRELARPADLS
jgi:hypothetical protein